MMGVQMEMELSLCKSRQVQQPKTIHVFVPFLKGSTPLPLGKPRSCSNYLPGLELNRVALGL